MKKNYKYIVFFAVMVILAVLTYKNLASSGEESSENSPRGFLRKNNTTKEETTEQKITKPLDQITQEIQALVEEENLKEAHKVNTQALRDYPNNEELYLLLAKIYSLQDQHSNLTQAIRKAQKTFPGSQAVKIMEAEALFVAPSDKKINNFLSFYSEISNPPTKLQAYEAITYIVRNDLTKSKNQLLLIKDQLDQKDSLSYQESRTYRLVIDVLSSVDDFQKLSEGKNAHLYALIAKILLLHQEPHLALEFCEYSIQENNDYIDAHAFKGITLYNLGRHQEAETALRKAYQLDSERPGVHYFLALTLHEQGKDEALMFFEKALSYDGFEFSNEVKWKLIDIFTEQKKYSKVQALYEELLVKSENEEDYEKAITLIIIKDPIKAESMARELIVKKPTSSKASNLLAWTLLQQNKLDEASKILNNLLKKDVEIAQTYLNLGLLQQKKNNHKEAQNNFKIANQKAKEQNNTALANWAALLYNKTLKNKAIQ